MKKIIGLLVAAIICIGVAFTVNINGGEEEVNKPLEQQNEESIAKVEEEESIEEEVNTKDTEKKEEIAKEDNSVNQQKDNSNSVNTPVNKESNDTVVKPEPEKKETVTIAINMQKAIDYGILKEDGFKHLSPNGVILSTKTVEIKSGDTVYDVLAKVVRENKIQMEYTGSGSSIYIQGIDNLYEFDCGKYSGWMYEVNGVYPNYGVGAYTLKAGDKITFNYTCDLGKDLK